VRLRLRLFASLTDRAGASELLLDLPEGTTVGELWEEACRQCPSLRGAPRPLVAVDLEYAPEEQVLSEGQEIALLPPVSGG
jgi:molybdopterin converting factor subunit 1